MGTPVMTRLQPCFSMLCAVFARCGGHISVRNIVLVTNLCAWQAVQCQQDRCVAILLEHEADPNLVDINGNTALHLAARIPSLSVAVLLLEHEANINAQNKVKADAKAEEASAGLQISLRVDPGFFLD